MDNFVCFCFYYLGIITFTATNSIPFVGKIVLKSLFTFEPDSSVCFVWCLLFNLNGIQFTKFEWIRWCRSFSSLLAIAIIKMCGGNFCFEKKVLVLRSFGLVRLCTACLSVFVFFFAVNCIRESKFEFKRIIAFARANWIDIERMWC